MVDLVGNKLWVVKEDEAKINDKCVLHFKFEKGAKIEVVWGEDGYGITQNVSPKTNDYDQEDAEFMYFRIWKRGNELYDPTVDIEAAQLRINLLEGDRGDLVVKATAVHTAEKELTEAIAGGIAETIATAKTTLSTAKTNLHEGQKAHWILEDTSYPFQEGSKIWGDEQTQKAGKAFVETVWGNIVDKHGALLTFNDILIEKAIRLDEHNFPYYSTGDEIVGNPISEYVYNYILLALPKRRYARLQEHPDRFTPQIKSLIATFREREPNAAVQGAEVNLAAAKLATPYVAADVNEAQAILDATKTMQKSSLGKSAFCISSHDDSVDMHKAAGLNGGSTYHQNGFDNFTPHLFGGTTENQMKLYPDTFVRPYYRSYVKLFDYEPVPSTSSSSTLAVQPHAYVLEGLWVEEDFVNENSLYSMLNAVVQDDEIPDEYTSYFIIQRVKTYARTMAGPWAASGVWPVDFDDAAYDVDHYPDPKYQFNILILLSFLYQLFRCLFMD